MLLERAIEIAVDAHRGQKDKAGEPYILHPLRVMCAMNTEDERIVAVLHDVLEDGGEPDRLRLFMAVTDLQLDALAALTRSPGEAYRAYIDRVAANGLATRVKLADLYDNLYPARLMRLPEKDRERLWRKYTNARVRLETGIWPEDAREADNRRAAALAELAALDGETL